MSALPEITDVDRLVDRLDCALRRMEPALLSLQHLAKYDWSDDGPALADLVRSLSSELIHYLDSVEGMLGTARMGSPFSDGEMRAWIDERCGGAHAPE